MNARDDILAAIKSADKSAFACASRSEQGRQSLLPPRLVRQESDLAALFVRKLTNVSSTYALVPRFEDVPAQLSLWLAEHSLSGEFLLAPEASLQSLGWRANGLRPSAEAPSALLPMTVVSGAFAGVGETGSVALLTNGTSRPSHNVLAESHVVVLERSRILATIEDVWRDVRRQDLPRSLAFVTGASRTADIEMSIELGVHGAVRMHVIIVG